MFLSSCEDGGLPDAINRRRISCLPNPFVCRSARGHFDSMRKQMRREGIPEQTWRFLYEKCGLKVLISGEGDDAEQYVYPPDNVLPFAPRTSNRCGWPKLRIDRALLR